MFIRENRLLHTSKPVTTSKGVVKWGRPVRKTYARESKRLLEQKEGCKVFHPKALLLS